jgi:hypothetical protein
MCVDYGVGGALLFGGFLFVLLQNCFSVLAADRENRPEASFIGIALACGTALFASFYYVWYDMAAVAAFFLTPLKDLIVGLMPANKHMQYVYSQAANDIGADFGKVYGAFVTSESTGAASGTMELQVSSALMSQLKSATGVDLGKFNKVAIDYAFAMDGDNELGYTLGLKLQDKELMTVKMYLDMQTGEMVMDVPGVLKKPIKVEAFDAAELNEAQINAMSQVNMESLPDEAFVSELIPQIIKAAFKQIDKVERSKQAFEAGGVEQKATCFEAEITMETVAKMADAALEEIKNNDKLQDAIVGFCEDNAKLLGDVDGDEAYDAFVEAIEDAQDEMKDVDDDEELFTLKTWVDNKNDIIALCIEIDGGEIFMGKATDGEKVGYEISVTEGKERLLYIGGEGTQKKDILALDLMVEVEDEEYVKIAIEDYDVKKAEEGYINGTFTVTPGKALAQMEPMLASAAVKMTVKMEGESGELIFDVQMQGASLGTLRMTVKSDSKTEVTIPSNAVDMESFTFDMVDVEALLNKLEAAGIDEDMLSSFGEMLMGGSDYEDYDASTETFDDYSDYL